MKNLQFVQNTEKVIEELEHKKSVLFAKEQFLNDILCEGEYYYSLTYGMDKKDKQKVRATLENKLYNITAKKIEIIHQVDILRELKKDTIKRIEADEPVEKFLAELLECDQ